MCRSFYSCFKLLLLAPLHLLRHLVQRHPWLKVDDRLEQRQPRILVLAYLYHTQLHRNLVPRQKVHYHQGKDQLVCQLRPKSVFQLLRGVHPILHCHLHFPPQSFVLQNRQDRFQDGLHSQLRLDLIIPQYLLQCKHSWWHPYFLDGGPDWNRSFPPSAAWRLVLQKDLRYKNSNFLLIG